MVDKDTLSSNNDTQPSSLKGLKILEMGQLLAGPFASTLLSWFGAEVIKIEPPGKGDALRSWRGQHGDTSLWWSIMGRNKKIQSSNDLSMYLLEQKSVVTVAGKAFGSDGNVRFSYAASDEDLSRAMDLLEETLTELE